MAETLAERLKRNNKIILISQLFTEDFFYAIRDMLNDEHFEQVFLDIPVYGESSNLVAQSLYEAAQTPDRYKVFFRILVEPFVAMKGVHHYDARYHSRK